MMDYKTAFPIKVGISCLEKCTHHIELLGSLNYKHNMSKHYREHKIKSMYKKSCSRHRSKRVVEEEKLGDRKVTCCRDQRKTVSQGQPISMVTALAASI